MTVRTKGEQKAYLDGYEMCAECIEKYLSDEGKKKLECLLSAVRNAVEIEDIISAEPCEDCIRRTEVIKAIDEREDVNGKVNAEDIRTDIVTMPSVQPKKGEWIPITKRPVTNEEQELYEDQELYLEGMMILTCPLPDDGEEVLITIYGGVETDTFYKDNDGCYFEGRDIDDVIAWQKKPEPYKESEVINGSQEI